MSRSNILLANSVRVASESRTRDSVAEHYQHMAPIAVGAGPLPAGKYLATSAPSIEMAVNGSSTAVNFDFAPASDEVVRVNRLSMVMVSPSATLDMAQFGNLAALTNGITIKALDTDSAVILDLGGGQSFKSNNDLAALFDLQIITQAAATTIVARLVLPQPIRLDGGVSERLRLVVADNLSALTRLRVRADVAYEDSLT